MCGLRIPEVQRISLTGFPAQSVRSSNTNVLDSPCLLVLNTGTSQSRQHDPYTVNVYQPMPSHVQNGHINNCFNINQDSRQCFDYYLVFPTSFGGFLHLASSMQLAVVVLVVLELVVELVLALGPELVLEFAPVHVESVMVQLESALVHLAIQTI
ncbi:hypothetical protein Tco_0305410 [Tanacetum coccineum]